VSVCHCLMELHTSILYKQENSGLLGCHAMSLDYSFLHLCKGQGVVNCHYHYKGGTCTDWDGIVFYTWTCDSWWDWRKACREEAAVREMGLGECVCPFFLWPDFQHKHSVSLDPAAAGFLSLNRRSAFRYQNCSIIFIFVFSV